MAFSAEKQQLAQFAVLRGCLHDIPHSARQVGRYQPEVVRVAQQTQQLKKTLVIGFSRQLPPNVRSASRERHIAVLEPRIS
ncbi:hypothetical protein D3C81_1685910 [compost metagenome]